MSAVLLAVFSDVEAAERVRVRLVCDGFPTDRVDLTALTAPGRADCEPARTAHERFVQYFGTLFGLEASALRANEFAERIEHGAAAVTVLPRGAVELERASKLLDRAKPEELMQRDLEQRSWEFAAAPHESTWIRSVWLEPPADAPHCIYCRLFPGTSHQAHSTQ